MGHKIKINKMHIGCKVKLLQKAIYIFNRLRCQIIKPFQKLNIKSVLHYCEVKRLTTVLLGSLTVINNYDNHYKKYIWLFASYMQFDIAFLRQNGLIFIYLLVL